MKTRYLAGFFVRRGYCFYLYPKALYKGSIINGVIINGVRWKLQIQIQINGVRWINGVRINGVRWKLNSIPIFKTIILEPVDIFVAVATTPKGGLTPNPLWNPPTLLIKCHPPFKANIFDVTAKNAHPCAALLLPSSWWQYVNIAFHFGTWFKQT